MRYRFALLAVLALLLLPTAGRAQVAAPGTLHLNATVGVNNPYIVNQNSYGRTELAYDIIFRPSVDLKVGYQLTKGLTVRTGLVYTQQGQHYDDEDVNARQEVDLSYLSFPLLADVQLGSDASGFYVHAGPQLSVRLGAEATRQGEPIVVDGQRDGDLYRTTDVAVLFEMGPYIRVAERTYLTVGLRGTYGLTDLNTEGARIAPAGQDYRASRNAYAGLHLGFHYTVPVRR